MTPAEVLQVLNKPLAQKLMRSSIPIRLAYIARDGSPRVVPIGFLWTGAHLVLCTLPRAAKVRAITERPQVALTLDSDAFPPKILLIRGTAALETVEGVPPEYLEASRKAVPPEGWDAFEQQVRGMYQQMVRITITPDWAKLIDFETTLPSAVEELVKARS
jgi:Pyridoxamine 5'-phosphate oxidase